MAKKSSRLKTLLDILKDGCSHTTKELQDRTGSCAVHSDIAEIRANGITVVRRYAGKNMNGRQINYYSLLTI